MKHHYSETELEHYSRGKLNFFARAICRIHLWNCDICRALLEKLQEDERLIADLKLSVSSQQEQENQETYRKLHDHFQKGEKDIR